MFDLFVQVFQRELQVWNKQGSALELWKRSRTQLELIKEGGTKRINQELQRKREQEGWLSGTAKAVARTALAVREIIHVEVVPLKRWTLPI